MSAEDDLDEPMTRSDSHMKLQIMKGVAKLSTNNSTKRNGGRKDSGTADYD